MPAKRTSSNRETTVGLWEYLPETSAIHQWTQDLCRAIATPFDRGSWSAVGHAVMIEHKDADEVRELLAAVACETGMKLCIIERERVRS